MQTIVVRGLTANRGHNEIGMIDVRMPTEFREMHAECARNVPVGLSAFIGAGLMFAGATGYCPMASTIASMPWNQCEGGGSCSA